MPNIGERIEKLEHDLMELENLVKQIDQVLAMHMADWNQARKEIRSQVKKLEELVEGSRR